MTRYGMLINTKKCVGCFACPSCLPDGEPICKSDESFIHFKEIKPACTPTYMPRWSRCSACIARTLPCQPVCPTHATYTTDSGVVLAVDETNASAASTAWLRVLTAPASCRRRPVWWRSAASAGTAAHWSNPPRCVNTISGARVPAIWTTRIAISRRLDCRDDGTSRLPAI